MNAQELVQKCLEVYYTQMKGQTARSLATPGLSQFLLGEGIYFHERQTNGGKLSYTFGKITGQGDGANLAGTHYQWFIIRRNFGGFTGVPSYEDFVSEGAKTTTYSINDRKILFDSTEAISFWEYFFDKQNKWKEKVAVPPDDATIQAHLMWNAAAPVYLPCANGVKAKFVKYIIDELAEFYLKAYLPEFMDTLHTPNPEKTQARLFAEALSKVPSYLPLADAAASWHGSQVNTINRPEAIFWNELRTTNSLEQITIMSLDDIRKIAREIARELK